MLAINELKKYSEKLLERWEYPWIFVATKDKFYCGLCKDIVQEDRINVLSENWVTNERQVEYLKLLNEFEK